MTHHVPTDIVLPPGGWCVGDQHCRMRTLLGSCVSITLWQPETRIGGMSHFLLPSRGRTAPGGELDGRYGDEALQLILRQLRRQGISPSQCRAKIFGGGNMFPAHAVAGSIQVGQRNGEAARSLLRERGIRVMSESLFGVGHRQVIFDIATGDVWLNQVKPTAQEIESENQSP